MKAKSGAGYIELKGSRPQPAGYDYEVADRAEHIYGLQYPSYQSSTNPPAADTDDKTSSTWVALAAVAALLTLTVVLLSLGASGHTLHGLSRDTAFRTQAHPEPPSILWGTVQKPYPTGAFWTNLVVGDGLLPIQLHPYGVAVKPEGVQVSYGAAHRMVSQAAIVDVFIPDLQLSSLEPYASRHVERFDNISVTMVYRLKGNSVMRTPLVKGSPFVTVLYENATPVISSVMHFTALEECSEKGLSDKRASGGKEASDRGSAAYELTLGNYQRWLLFCSEPISLARSGDTLAASGAITGYCRVAVLPLQNSGAALRALLAHAPRYATGGGVSVRHTDDKALVTFAFSSVGAGPLLMLALPHHSRVLVAPGGKEAGAVVAAYAPILSTKGRMRPVVGDTWTLAYPHSRVSWGYEADAPLADAQLAELRSSLQTDLLAVPPRAADPYGFGKELARMAHLALIAEQLDMPEARLQALAVIEEAMLPWLQGLNSDALLYDLTYGGVVSTDGLADSSSDFGSGWYNDHHFHYGYFVYAAAVLAKMDPAFWLQHQAAMDALVRDFCNPDSRDPDFPFARHKDLFDGHSWASGLVPQGNGKSQESSSEAVNAYYSAHLYGVATGNAELARFANLMMSMELLSTSYYWHMADSSIYDRVFTATRMVGNVGALDATTSTWFGNQPEYVHGINVMPVTPATALLLDHAFVAAAYPVLARSLPLPVPAEMQLCSASAACSALGMTGLCCPTAAGAFLACCDTASTGAVMSDEWRSLIYQQHAVIDRDAAWTELAAMQNYGQGGSRANSLLWAATRGPPLPELNATAVPSTDPLANIDKACAANSACVAQGLDIGDCCPAIDPKSLKNLVLGCCPMEAKQGLS